MLGSVSKWTEWKKRFILEDGIIQTNVGRENVTGLRRTASILDERIANLGGKGRRNELGLGDLSEREREMG